MNKKNKKKGLVYTSSPLTGKISYIVCSQDGRQIDQGQLSLADYMFFQYGTREWYSSPRHAFYSMLLLIRRRWLIDE